MSSSPSTRFTGEDVDGLRESDMPSLPLKSYMQEYAGSKARGELAMTAACSEELMTVSIARQPTTHTHAHTFSQTLTLLQLSGRNI